jgi:hypothetical protein
MGAAFLCADLGITPEVREDHATPSGLLRKTACYPPLTPPPSGLSRARLQMDCIFRRGFTAPRAEDDVAAELGEHPHEALDRNIPELATQQAGRVGLIDPHARGRFRFGSASDR